VTPIAEVDTPAILIDLDVMDRNLERVAAYTRQHGLRLRPHTKTHKIPALARRQMDLGAVGVTVAKVSEAEVMLNARPDDLLVAYPVIGPSKTARLMEVAHKTSVTVSIDSSFAARELSNAATKAGVAIGVLAEIDVGLRRVGVHPGEELTTLVREIGALPGLAFHGLAFYPGHIKRADDSMDTALAEVNATVRSAVRDCERAGQVVSIVSGGSTPALFRSHCVPSMNEIRPGTYIFNDRNTWMTGACSLEDCAAYILTTVVSTAVPGQIIIDGGSKTFSSDRCAAAEAEGFGFFPEAPGAVLERMNEEHGYVNIRQAERSFRIGERVRVLPNHICVAMNLHERVYGIRGDRVVETWTVAGRGKLQ
jgi:D-serine deaminase-like pyridoxal phosphate-dependent protein